MTIDVPTVYGDVSVAIPEGTQPEGILKLRGKGVKDLRTGRPGDEYLHIKVKTPANLTASEKSLLEEFRKQEEAKGAKWWHNPFKR